ncbi:hypothetical protein AOQ84DRAFT_355962 [Glonium stellatum]|uniref:Uncharacterized protein n=1 Tax=Glonium stellatum TaxID=574774 RepID=A0A8E2EV41_9PEZI|nr:hypothetical protein AOQ84DRAFT_355962 [Glonium stellatum]
MKFMVLLLPFALAAPTSECRCECAKPKCSGTFPEVCLCENKAQVNCYEKCGVQPTILPCPMGTSTLEARDTIPTTTLDSTSSLTPTCLCEPTVCTEEWPQSCYCENEVKLNCYNKCGGPLPLIFPCPAAPPV